MEGRVCDPLPTEGTWLSPEENPRPKVASPLGFELLSARLLVRMKSFSAAVSRCAVRSSYFLPFVRGISSVHSPGATPFSASLWGLVSHAPSGDTSSLRGFIAIEKTARLSNLWAVRTTAFKILSTMLCRFSVRVIVCSPSSTETGSASVLLSGGGRSPTAKYPEHVAVSVEVTTK